MATEARAERLEKFLGELRRHRGPITAKVIGERLGISVRTVRDYAATLNSGLARPLIVSDQLGYVVDEDVYRNSRPALLDARDDSTPKGRLAALIRYLVHDERVDVHEVADHFFVSVPTIESDLGRVRAIIRSHELTLSRDGDLLFLEGGERAKRRLLRSVLFSADGGSPLQALLRARDTPNSVMARISGALTSALATSGLELNEYIRGELLVHLAVAVERSSGDGVASTTFVDGPGLDPLLTGAVRAIIQEVERATGAKLGEDEGRVLFALLLTNSRRHGEVGTIEPQPEMMELTRDALRTLTTQFGVRREDESHLPALALHLQQLRERAFMGKQLASPVGASLKREHPLLHEMSLLFAHILGMQTGLEIEAGEVDYLTLHLGAYFQSELESGPLVSVTLVSPQHGSLTRLLSEKVGDALRGLATIENVITSVGVEPEDLTSDLVVTTFTPPVGLPCPCVVISPFGSDADLRAIREAVRLERARQRNERLRSTLISVLEPELFIRTQSFSGREEAIETGAALLLDHGLVEPGFVADVKERDRRSSTTFGTGFAIPHSLYQDAYRTGICVLSVEEPISWAGSDVFLVVMCAIAPDGLATFRDILDVLVEILLPPGNVKTLTDGSKSFEGFQSTLLSLLP